MKTRTARVGMTIVTALAVVCLLWTVHTGAFPGSQAFGQTVEKDRHEGDDHGKTEKPGEHKGCTSCAAEKPGEHDGDDHGKTEKPGEHKGCTSCAAETPGEHDGDDHDEHGEKADPHAGHDEHGEEGPVVKMTAAQAQKFGIALATAGAGEIQKEIRLPGEIVINADRSAHVVPSAPGISRKVLASVGDTVAAGDVLALVESATLAEAKSDYLTKLNELSCCSMDLTRAQDIHDNTAKLLEVLDGGPSLDELTRLDSAAMGKNRASLVSAYAELVFTRDAYQREHKLAADNLARKSDLETAEAAYKKAHAIYIATRDSTSYATTKALLEAKQSRSNQELAVETAERKLTILGQAPQAVTVAPAKPEAECTDPNCKDCKAKAKAATTAPAGSTKCKADCTDPNCKECKAKAAAPVAGAGDLSLDDKLGWYALRAPFAGTIIAKHIVLGEKLTGDADVFTIADMSTVWVDLDIYQKDLAFVRRGQAVEIHVGTGVGDGAGTIAYISPIVDPRTRTGLARIVLPNPKGQYRPGLFVTAHVVAATYDVPVLVPGDAVQNLAGETVVFVPDDEGFRGQIVKVGRSSRTHVEVIEGLHAGEKYVVKGAFKLKAEIKTSGLDPHAGHGH